MSRPRILLTRDGFREAVFARDEGKCVCCGAPAADAHHIMDRKLFPDGGYYLDNGASVCADHHMLCETTEISVEEIRAAAGIRNPVMPLHLEDGARYDKWGNPVLPNGMRQPGELFFDENVQKALAAGNVLHLFTNRFKYPRTPHLSWSAAIAEDDRVADRHEFDGHRVVATVKMDGENSTLYRDYLHARSIDGRTHPSRDWLKAFWAERCGDIPDGWRVCGENMFAVHSIRYDSLKSYFYGFSVWNEVNVALPWDETLEWFELLRIEPVEVIYDGIWDEAELKRIAKGLDPDRVEGFVVRRADAVPARDFGRMFAKYVRPGHVQTDEHWMYGAGVTEQNGLAAEGAPRP